MTREFQLTTTFEKEDISDAWLGVIGDRSDRFLQVYSCEFGWAEETIALMTFRRLNVKGNHHEFEVGVGEPLRPYEKVYHGFDLKKALDAFFDTCMKHITL